MPEPVVNQEALARAALIKEGSTIGASASAEVQRHEAMYRASLAKMPGGETTANLSQVLEAQSDVTQQKGENALEANIGTQVDKAGKKLRTEPGTKDRFDSAREAEEIGRRLSTEPYESLSNDQQEQVRAQFDEVINATALSGLDDASRRLLFQDFIKDPEVLHLLRTEYSSVTRKRLGEQVTESQRKFEEAKIKETAAKSKRRRIETELKGKRAAQESYENGTNAEDMARLGSSPAKAKNLRSQIENRRERISDLRSELRRAKAEDKTAISDEIEEVRKEIDGETGLISQLDQAEIDAAKYEALKDGKTGLPEKISNLEAQLDEAEEAYQLATGERGAAEVGITSARSRRIDEEREWIGQLKNLPRTAMAHYVEGKIGKANQIAAEALLDDDGSKENELEGKLKKHARARYHKAKPPTFWNKSTVEPNRENVMLDIKILTDPEKGASAILETALKAQSLSDTEVKAKMADAAFVSKWEATYAQQLFGSYIRLKGKVTPDMYGYISSQPWGENLVKNAIEANSGLKAKEAELKAAGVIGPGGIAEYIKTKKKTLGTAALAALLTGIFGGIPAAMAGGLAVGASSLGSDITKQAYSQG